MKKETIINAKNKITMKKLQPKYKANEIKYGLI